MTRCLVTLGLCMALAAPAAAQSPGDEGVGPGRTQRPPRREAPEEAEEQGADESAEEDRGPRRDRGERGERGPGEDRGGREGFGGFRRPNPMFEAIDANGDGTINNVELRKAIAALRKLDADGDGNITLAEATPQGLAATGFTIPSCPIRSARSRLRR